MPELWFFAGLLMGVALAGFAAVGSFERGVSSVRRIAWSREISARQRAVVAVRPARREPSPAPSPASSPSRLPQLEVGARSA